MMMVPLMTLMARMAMTMIMEMKMTRVTTVTTCICNSEAKKMRAL